MVKREKAVAVVADNKDPEQRLRIKVKCAALMGDEEIVYDEWIRPKLTWGFICVPDIKDQVEIEFTSGSDTDETYGQSFLDTPDIWWTGSRFQGPSKYDEMLTTNYGKRRGFVTPAGHILMFDDSKGKEKINLVWHSNAGSYAMFSMDEDGSVLLANKNGSLLYLNAASHEIAMIDEYGNSFSTCDTGIKLINKAGDFIELNSDNQVIQVQGSNVFLGGLSGTEPAVLGDTLITLFADHIHPTGTGPSGPPVVGSGGNPLLWAALKSQVVQLK